MRRRRRAQPRADPGGAASRRADVPAGHHPRASRRVRRATPPPAGRTAAKPTTSPADAAAAPAAGRSATAARHSAALARPSCSSAPASWWFALRDTKPDLRPGAVQRPRLGAGLGARQSAPQLRDRANVFHQMSPFWYEIAGVDLIDLSTSSTPTRSARPPRTSSTRPDTAASRWSPRSSTPPTAGVMAAILADPDRAGRPRRRDRRVRRRATTSTASTSTTRTSPSRTTATRGRRHGRTG